MCLPFKKIRNSARFGSTGDVSASIARHLIDTIRIFSIKATPPPPPFGFYYDRASKGDQASNRDHREAFFTKMPQAYKRQRSLFEGGF